MTDRETPIMGLRARKEPFRQSCCRVSKANSRRATRIRCTRLVVQVNRTQYPLSTSAKPKTELRRLLPTADGTGTYCPVSGRRDEDPLSLPPPHCSAHPAAYEGTMIYVARQPGGTPRLAGDRGGAPADASRSSILIVSQVPMQLWPEVIGDERETVAAPLGMSLPAQSTLRFSALRCARTADAGPAARVNCNTDASDRLTKK